MADLLSDDPAAEFLQQEGDQLRELGIDEDQFNNATNLSKGDMGGLMEDFGGDLDTQTSQDQPIVNGFMSDPSPMPAVEIPLEEPESLKKWREEREVTLKKQEDEEEEDQQLWREKAKKELDDWYHHYNEQLDKVKKENRIAEDQFIEEMTDTKPGNLWEKVARYCDFNPKYSKSTKDVSRMRGLLLQLKQNPLQR